MVSIHRGSDCFTNQLMNSDVRSISTEAVWKSDVMLFTPELQNMKDLTDES